MGAKIELIAELVRFVSAIMGIAVCVVSVYGFSTADELYTEGDKDVVDGTTFQELGLFVGASLVYVFLAGILIFLAEVRTEWIRRKLLSPFRFLLSYLGRGITLIFVGFMFVVLQAVYAKVVAAITIFCGLCQMVLTCCLSSEYKAAHGDGSSDFMPKRPSSATSPSDPSASASAAAIGPATAGSAPADGASATAAADPSFASPFDAPQPTGAGTGAGAGPADPEAGQQQTPTQETIETNPFLSM